MIVYGDGSQARDFIYVEDLCDGIVKGLDAEATGVIQLGSGRPVTVNDLIGEMRRTVAPRAIEAQRAAPRRRGSHHLVRHHQGAAGARLRAGDLAGRRSARTWRWFLDRFG